MGDKVGDADKQQIEAAIAALKQALEGDDVEAITTKTEELKQASYKIAEELYKTQAAETEGEGATMFFGIFYHYLPNTICRRRL